MPKSKAITTTFEKKVKIALLESEMTQAELAEQIGVTRQYLNGVIRGKIKSDNVMCKISAFVEGLNGD